MPILGRGSGWKLAFNNDGDDANILTPDGSIVATLTYPKMKSGFSFARDPVGDSYCVTERPTPGTANECVTTLVASKKTVKEKSAAKKSTAKKKAAPKPKKAPVRYRNILSSGEGNHAQDAISEKLMQLRALETGGSTGAAVPSSIGHFLKYEFLALAIAILLLTELTFRVR